MPAVAPVMREASLPAQRGRVVRFPRKATAKLRHDLGLRASGVWVPGPERLAKEKAAADLLPGLLIAVDAPPLDAAARARLERLIYWHGTEFVTLLIRAVNESEGNANALTEPVISAVAQVMRWRPKWPERGLPWIEAFDGIPLMMIVQAMRELDLFKEESIGAHLAMIVHNKLLKVLDPPAPPPKKPGPKTGRKRGVRKGKSPAPGA